MKKQLYLENGLSKYNEGDNCFLQCMYPNCFPEHEFEDVADKVKMCINLKEQSIFREATWD